nr:GAF domain-containing protein [Tanacetum cinerariifolium]
MIPKHDEVFDDDEHILDDVPVSMINFNFNPDPKQDLSIAALEVYEHDLDVIDYDSFGSDLDGGIDSERRTQLRELRKIGKEKNQEHPSRGKTNSASFLSRKFPNTFTQYKFLPWNELAISIV